MHVSAIALLVKDWGHYDHSKNGKVSTCLQLLQNHRIVNKYIYNEIVSLVRHIERITDHHMTWHYITWNHLTWNHIISFHPATIHITSPHTTSQTTTLLHATSQAWHHTTSHRSTLHDHHRHTTKAQPPTTKTPPPDRTAAGCLVGFSSRWNFRHHS